MGTTSQTHQEAKLRDGKPSDFTGRCDRCQIGGGGENEQVWERRGVNLQQHQSSIRAGTRDGISPSASTQATPRDVSFGLGGPPPGHARTLARTGEPVAQK